MAGLTALHGRTGDNLSTVIIINIAAAFFLQARFRGLARVCRRWTKNREKSRRVCLASMNELPYY
jgi:hypothetical protein